MHATTEKRYLLVGGAGFIGSHCLKRLVENETNIITVFDNFSTGREWHLDTWCSHHRVRIIRGDVKDLEHLTSVMRGQDTVYHFAANANISKAVTEPSVDFWEGTYLTQNVLEAMRKTGSRRIIYTSGSGVYGDMGDVPVVEGDLTHLPISPYGASKLASEALISAYVHMFDMEALIFRFANVIGPHQTHGVAYDFVRNLLKNPQELVIMGDGSQLKSYLYIDDVVDAITRFEYRGSPGLQVFNVATEDYLTVQEIAEMAVQILGLNNITFRYTGGKRGWKGDIPKVFFDTSRLRAMGWENHYTSRQSIKMAIVSLIEDAREGRFDND